MSTFVLANDTLRLEFDARDRRLVGLTAVETGWQILDRPQLGLSFRLLVPLPDRRNNPVYGEKQTLSRRRSAPQTAAALRFRWDGVTSEHGGPLDIKLTLDVQLTERQADLSDDGREPLRSTSSRTSTAPTWATCSTRRGAEWFKTFLYNYATAQEWSLWPTFQNMRGYYGVDYPTQFGRWSAGVGRADVALHPAARRAAGPLCRRLRAEHRAGRLAHRAAPRLRQLDRRPRARRAHDRRQGRGHALRRRARALHPARRDARADARSRWRPSRAAGSRASTSTSAGAAAG